MTRKDGIVFCCEAFVKEVDSHVAFVGGGSLYPNGLHPTGQIERDDNGTWVVNGCCGGGCYVLTGIKFCPFCGTKLETESR